LSEDGRHAGTTIPGYRFAHPGYNLRVRTRSLYREGLERDYDVREQEGKTMNFTQAIQAGFQKYVTFSGRAARSEYWYWTLFMFIASVVAGLIDFALFPFSGFSPIQTVVNLGLFLPALAISVRRLHDLDSVGWWLLLIFTGIGILILVIWFCVRGTVGPNRFGPDPLGALQP
jgi:uncharacterized membrane protein YhaH (DUF805 family)